MYDSPHQFEPLFPDAVNAALHAKAAKIAESTVGLSAFAHPTARDAIRDLLRSMNSYYSNKIEGQETHPLNIEKALHQSFSDQPNVAKLQRIALAHIHAEQELEQRIVDGESALKSDFLIASHRALYSQLIESDRTTEDGHIIVPGQIRQEMAEVGRHVPPIPASIASFMAKMDSAYDKSRSWDKQLIAIACLHHRTTWLHPFRDSNGRAARLQSQCALRPLSNGLWSPNRGLARARPDYYAHLQNADEPRRGDLDGRGNLSLAGLTEWVDFFLSICDDQVQYMCRMLELDGMRRRIAALISFRHAHDKQFRPEAVIPLYHVFAAGPVTRGEFAQMTGLGERTARDLIANLLAAKLLVSDKPLGPVRIGLPLDSLQFLFPELYPEANTQNDQ